MLVKFETEGGFASFPGLRAPVEIDTDDLPEEEAAGLVHHVREANLFERPEGPVETPSGAADLRLHRITVHEGARSRTMRIREPIDDPALRTLVNVLEERARVLRRARGPEGDRP